MSRAHHGLLACLGALWLCTSRDARAEVVWHGASCGSATPSPATTRAGEEPRVDIDVVQHEAGWAATLTARYPSGAAGTRNITAASCAELERAVAVSLSLLEPADTAQADQQRGPAVASSNTTAASPPSNTTAANPASSTTPPSAPSNTTAASDVPREAAATRSDAGEPFVDAGVSTERVPRVPGAEHAVVRLAALVGTGGGRFAELGAALSGGLWLGRWGGRVELSARRPPSALSAEQDVSLEITRLASALELCGRSDTSIDWGLCAGPRLELVTGLASGPSDPKSDAVWLPGVGAGAFLRVPIAASWALAGELQGSWALRGAEATVRPWGRVYELPRLGASLLVGVEWELF